MAASREARELVEQCGSRRVDARRIVGWGRITCLECAGEADRLDRSRIAAASRNGLARLVDIQGQLEEGRLLAGRAEHSDQWGATKISSWTSSSAKTQKEAEYSR